MRIEGGSALITGGTSGLGLAVARRLLAGGAKVVVTGRGEERGRAAVRELGPGAEFVSADVCDEEAMARAVDRAAALGRFGAAVCCAGTGAFGRTLGRRGPLPLAEFAEVISANLVGTFNTARLAAAAMAGLDPEDGERGAIVCCSSIAAFDGQRGQVAYATSKAAVCGMTLPLARDLSEYGIRVVTVAPGIFETPMVAAVRPDTLAAIAAQTPQPSRLGRPEEFAALVAHVLTNPMLNGEVIRLDGACRLGHV